MLRPPPLAAFYSTSRAFTIVPDHEGQSCIIFEMTAYAPRGVLRSKLACGKLSGRGDTLIRLADLPTDHVVDPPGHGILGRLVVEAVDGVMVSQVLRTAALLTVDPAAPMKARVVVADVDTSIRVERLGFRDPLRQRELENALATAFKVTRRQWTITLPEVPLDMPRCLRVGVDGLVYFVAACPQKLVIRAFDAGKQEEHILDMAWDREKLAAVAPRIIGHAPPMLCLEQTVETKASSPVHIYTLSNGESVRVGSPPEMGMPAGQNPSGKPVWAVLIGEWLRPYRDSPRRLEFVELGPDGKLIRETIDVPRMRKFLKIEDVSVQYRNGRAALGIVGTAHDSAVGRWDYSFCSVAIKTPENAWEWLDMPFSGVLSVREVQPRRDQYHQTAWCLEDQGFRVYETAPDGHVGLVRIFPGAGTLPQDPPNASEQQ